MYELQTTCSLTESTDSIVSEKGLMGMNVFFAGRSETRDLRIYTLILLARKHLHSQPLILAVPSGMAGTNKDIY